MPEVKPIAFRRGRPSLGNYQRDFKLLVVHLQQSAGLVGDVSATFHGSATIAARSRVSTQRCPSPVQEFDRASEPGLVELGDVDVRVWTQGFRAGAGDSDPELMASDFMSGRFAIQRRNRCAGR